MGNNSSRRDEERSRAAWQEAQRLQRQLAEAQRQAMREEEERRRLWEMAEQQAREQQRRQQEELARREAAARAQAAAVAQRAREAQEAERLARLRLEEEQRQRAAAQAEQARQLQQEKEAAKRRVQEELQRERERVHAEKLERWQRLNRDYPLPNFLQPYVSGPDDERQVNMAFLGNSGKGKSSLMKALFKHLTGRELLCLKVSLQSDGTFQPTPVRLPAEFFGRAATLWDLPGQGTEAIPSKTYLRDMGLKYFDLLVIVTDGRWGEQDTHLLQAIQAAEKRCVVVRSKVDLAVDDGEHDFGWSPEKTLQEVRTKVQDATLMDPGRIFLTTCRESFWQADIGCLNDLCAQLKQDLATLT